MSDSYHYEDGAIHHDHKKVLHIDKLQGAELQQLMHAFFKDDAEEAVVVNEEPCSTTLSLSDSRQAILDQLLDLADKGDWVNGITSEHIKTMLKAVLGLGESQLKGMEAKMSETLWNLLESGRSERLRVTWQNMIGYYDDRRLLKQKSSPALNKDFFGNKDGSDNINKGRPSRGNMSSGFREILPLLDAYVPKLDKKA